MIDNFKGKHAFLSNFHPSVIKYKGHSYKTVEHAFQAAKTLREDERQKIQNTKTPGQAKKTGRKVRLRPDWERVKDDVMLDCLRAKFKNQDFRKKLLATGKEDLVEGNTWGDRYWGVCKGTGKNMLGKLLMKVREEISSLLETSRKSSSAENQ